MLRLDVEVFINSLNHSAARGVAADLSGTYYGGEENSARYWYRDKTESEIKDWLRAVLNQDQMPDTQWIEKAIAEAMWGPLE